MCEHLRGRRLLQQREAALACRCKQVSRSDHRLLHLPSTHAIMALLFNWSLSQVQGIERWHDAAPLASHASGVPVGRWPASWQALAGGADWGQPQRAAAEPQAARSSSGRHRHACSCAHACTRERQQAALHAHQARAHPAAGQRGVLAKWCGARAEGSSMGVRLASSFSRVRPVLAYAKPVALLPPAGAGLR